MRRSVPGRSRGPSRRDAVRLLAGSRREPLDTVIRLYREHGDIVRIPVLPGRGIYLLSRPEHAEHVLAAQQGGTGAAVAYRPVRELPPQPARLDLAGFVPAVGDATRRMLTGWDGWPDGAVVDVSMTTRRLGRTVMQTAPEHRQWASVVASVEDDIPAALTCAWYVLSTNPAARRRLEAEVDAVFSDQPGGPNVDRLTWTRAVLCEALRLYPPSGLIERRAVAEDTVDGIRIPAGSTVVVSPYLVHRHPSGWDNPEGFDPGRFLPPRVARRHRYAFIPFAEGPSSAVLDTVVLTGAMIVLAELARRYRLDLAPGARTSARSVVTLRPLGGLPMILRRRGTERID